MKKNQLRELKAKDLKELIKMLKEERDELAKILLDLNSNKLRNVSLKKIVRKNIAQIQTLIREKELTKI